MQEITWFERELIFQKSSALLPYFLERLEGTIVRIESKVKGINNTTLSEKYNGKWSIKQNIGHLAEVDTVANKRIDEMVNSIPVMSPAVFEPQDYSLWPIEDMIALFSKNRKAIEI